MITLNWFFGEEKDLTDAHTIRRAVFINEQGISEADEMDGTDGSCIHLVAYVDNDIPAATGRIMITRDDFMIGRVAVLREYRGKQLGKIVMQALVNACCDMGGERQILHAQLSARPFYEKLGFTAYGEEYEEAGTPHISMEHFGSLSECRNKQRKD